MENDENIVRYSLAELKEMNARGTGETDWARLDAMTDEEFEASIDWEDEGRFEWGAAYPTRFPPVMRTATVCFDQVIVAWFKARGGNYSARIRLVLRDYVDARLMQLAGERAVHRR